MRWIGFLLLLSVCIGWLPARGIAQPATAHHLKVKASQKGGTSFTSHSAASRWRRTTRGWEPTDNWTIQRSPQVWSPATKVHPLLVGMLELLVSLGALLLFSSKRVETAVATTALKHSRPTRLFSSQYPSQRVGSD